MIYIKVKDTETDMQLHGLKMAIIKSSFMTVSAQTLNVNISGFLLKFVCLLAA